MDNCLFCKIIAGEIPSNKVYEDDYVYSFYDINPIAPVHVVVVPKTHIANVNEVTAENSDIVAHIFEAIPKIAEILGVQDGYNLINNCGEKAGQTVMHLHFHLISGLNLDKALSK